ncbi:hypothetical protein HRJ34_20040 [Rhizorhabdus wittichii]|uniref:Transmembrane protein n=1 Tax=Rhizorhabdus wittichii TaxID=160791 RepID=A0A975HCU0_9SPHN|nr:hypothetical protein [Rhizorhabdus wittichii]QTH20608.1 hypothetical protein HRJ34_20040 [Rhizorhabdus wittichii]
MLRGVFDIYELIVAGIVWIFLFVPVLLVGRACHLSRAITIFVYLWHTLCSFLMISIVLNIGGDEIAYYEGAISGITFSGKYIDIGVGTMFIYWITHVVIDFFDFGFISTFMIFNFIGSVGVVIFGGVISDLQRSGYFYDRAWIWACVALPGLSIWTTSIGKDAFSILAIGLFLKGSMSPRSLPMLGLAVFLMFLVRPHIGIPMALSMAIMTSKGGRTAVSGVIGPAVVAVILLVMLPILTQRLGLVDLSNDSLTDYVSRQGGSVLNRDDGAFWYSQPLPVRWMMTAFYPTILSASGFMEFGVALENIVLMGFFGFLLWRTRFMTRFQREDLHLVLLMLGIWIMLGSLMYNSGLAARQKWMFMPIMLYLALKYSNSVNRREQAAISFKC